MLMMSQVRKFANKLKDIDTGIRLIEKVLLLSKKGLFFPTKKKVLRNFKNKLFPTKNLEPDVESE